MPRDIEVCSIQPAGRETRFEEPLGECMLQFAAQAASAIAPLLETPFALFGHSMGALAAFETARQLRSRGEPAPVRLFVSGHRGPQVPSRLPALHAAPDDEMVAQLEQRYGPVPAEILADAFMRAHYLGILRADMKMVETYRYAPEKPLECGISAFGGELDRIVPPDHIEDWSEQTASSFNLQIFPGDHFFLNTATEQVLQTVVSDLRCGAAGPL